MVLFRLLRAPFWVFFLLAGGAGFLTYLGVQGALEREADRAIAATQPAPQVVEITQFDRKTDMGLLNEVHLRTWIDYEHNYHLTKERKGVDTERYMFVLFGEGDDDTSTVARGVMMLTEAESEIFFDRSDDFVHDYTENGEVFHFNGTGSLRPELNDMVKDAFEAEGLTRAPNFVVVDPFWNGRAAAMAPRENAVMNILSFGLGLTVLLAAIGVFKRIRTSATRRRATGQQPTTAGSMAASAPTTDNMASTMMSAEPSPNSAENAVENQVHNFDEDSPLGRIHAKSRPSTIDAAGTAAVAQATSEIPANTPAKPILSDDRDKKSSRNSKTESALIIGAIVLVLAGVFVPSISLAAVLPFVALGGLWFVSKIGFDELRDRAIFGTVDFVANLLPAKKVKPENDPFSRLR